MVMNTENEVEEVRIRRIREVDYPQLNDVVYLDHAGTTPYAKSLIERFSADLTGTLYGNPHSAAPSSIRSTSKVEDIRHEALRFFNADPQYFDLVFVANATAGTKLVMDSFRSNNEAGFWYGYHKDSHTSLVGVREAAKLGSACFESDDATENWLSEELTTKSSQLELFAYPAQSNMNGRRLPIKWCRKLRANRAQVRQCYSLLDAAALVATSPLDLGDVDSAPDFTVLSFYKIFGFPDLGALIIRKAAADVLCRHRDYFGGGTVDMVACLRENWHAAKSTSLHASLEDGTLPIHNILALKHAFDVHLQLYGSMKNVSSRITALAKELHDRLACLKHSNGTAVCKIYEERAKPSAYGNAILQGPILAFNIRNCHGAWISTTEVDKLASIKGIHIRTGGVCNPGGIATFLDLAPWEIRENFSSGHRCGSEEDIVGGKPTGVLRLSLGAMSTLQDIEAFLDFMYEFFVEKTVDAPTPYDAAAQMQSMSQGDFYVESLTVYPIKSCAGWHVPADQAWEVQNEGLAWDREWCLIHQSTGVALTQKRHPKMALIRPRIDLKNAVLRVAFGSPSANNTDEEVSVPLSADPTYLTDNERRDQVSTVFGDSIIARTYTSSALSDFFTRALGVPCQLARFPRATTSSPAKRHVKEHLSGNQHIPSTPQPLLLSNESPILIISRSSLNRLNEQIKARGGKAARAEAFRANIVVAQHLSLALGSEQPYVEDTWQAVRIGKQRFQILGPCRRCQMVCIDQRTGERNGEPFLTLAKTRRFEGKVWFGQHSQHVPVHGRQEASSESQNHRIRVGDAVVEDKANDGN